tara:strand:+ start:838 stop:1083 length:246 start_codon:yes stop_codon:yes gene_type:complete
MDCQTIGCENKRVTMEELIEYYKNRGLKDPTPEFLEKYMKTPFWIRYCTEHMFTCIRLRCDKKTTDPGEVCFSCEMSSSIY